jgi:uncharacterized protein YjbJ (UPF0337 family)
MIHQTSFYLQFHFGGVGLIDKFKNEKGKAVGKVVESIGRTIDDEELEFKGKMQFIKSDIGSKLEDKKDKVLDKANDFIDQAMDRNRNKNQDTQ